MDLRTPLKRVRHLGSAKDGTEHFWLQRMTAAALVVLSLGLIWVLVYLAGADHATARATIAHPAVAVMLLILVIAGMVHMRLGMQVIIEDYIQDDRLKIVLLMLNTFFAFAIGLACIFAVMKLSFGA